MTEDYKMYGMEKKHGEVEYLLRFTREHLVWKFLIVQINQTFVNINYVLQAEGPFRAAVDFAAMGCFYTANQTAFLMSNPETGEWDWKTIDRNNVRMFGEWLHRMVSDLNVQTLPEWVDLYDVPDSWDMNAHWYGINEKRTCPSCHGDYRDWSEDTCMTCRGYGFVPPPKVGEE